MELFPSGKLVRLTASISSFNRRQRINNDIILIEISSNHTNTVEYLITFGNNIIVSRGFSSVETKRIYGLPQCEFTHAACRM